MDLPEAVRRSISKFSMLSGGETVLVGLSGGPDSTCLAMVLKELSPELSLSVRTLYVDHGLRPEETPGEIRFARELSAGLDMPFSVRNVEAGPFAREHGLSIQEAARRLRLAALEEEARETGSRLIALGHNLDDQAETMVMRFLRGSGPTGLAGIAPVRGQFIRPLIETERKDIEAFLSRRQVVPIRDPSNLKLDYLRNRLRVQVMPLLREINPDLSRTLAHTAEVFREEERYFSILVTKALMKLISRKTDTSIELFLAPLEAMEKVILRRVLRRAIDETRGLRGIGFPHVEDIITLLKEGLPGDRVHLPGGVRVIKKYSTVLLTSEEPVRLGTYSLEAGGEVLLGEAGLVIAASVSHEKPSFEPDYRYSAVFDAGKAAGPFTVRPRQDGDSFLPLGFGRTKKLQDFFVDAKVPREERDAVPIVTTREGEILWVVGHRGDERFRPTDETRTFLILRATPARA
jgi:tRNA(Ile)-lysidine synthase